MRNRNISNVTSVNQNILNIITPSGLEFNKTSFVSGENYGKCITMSKFPTNPEYGWLSKIISIEGTTCSIEFNPTESGPLIERCNDQIKQYKIDLSTVKEESLKQQKEKAIEDIKKMIKRINEDGETVGYVNIIFKIQATTKEKLEERVKKVNSIVSSIGGGGGSTRNLTFYQDKAFQSVSPYGIPIEELENIGSRNMPFSTFIGGFPNASSGINDGSGFKLGSSENGKPTIIDTWKRGGDRVNCNWFISGIPGMGKSATVKLILLFEYALGCKIIILDPDKEYTELVSNLGGKIINCGGGKGGKINPLQVRAAPKLDEEDEDGEDDFYKDVGKGVSDLALHFQTLRTFFKLYKSSLTELEMSKLEEILEETYARFHIKWETNIKKLKPTDYPIFSDLYEDILKHYEKDKEDKILQNLVAYLRSISIGADSFIFNGHTNIEFDTDIIDLDISNLLEGDENILRAQSHNINSWVWQQVSRDRNEKILYFIDEGYLIVDPDNPEAIKFVKNFSKRIRKYNGGLIFITHAVVDVLDPAVKRYGQAIVDNACFKFIMGTDGKNLMETKELFNLTEAETTLLGSKQRGKGLLFAGSSRVSTRIEISEKFLTLMGTAGGK